MSNTSNHMELPHASTARILLSGCNTSTFWCGSQNSLCGYAEPTRLLQKLPTPPPKLFFAVKWRRLIANLVEHQCKLLRDSAIYSKPRNCYLQQAAPVEPMRPLRRPTNAPPPKLFFATRWRRLISSLVSHRLKLSIAGNMREQPQPTSVVEPIRLLPAPAPPPKHCFATRWRGLIARLTEHQRTLSALAQDEPQS